MNPNESRIFQLADTPTEPIERIEQDDGSVRYTNIRLLGPGVWTDAGSRETIWYSPEGIKNLTVAEDNVLNVAHDVENEVSAVGRIDPDSVGVDEGGYKFGDIVLDRENAASEYADENLQQTLESEGAKGFGGPSVEISGEGQEVVFNEEKGMQELKDGIIEGAGLVMNPASKNVSFARQSAERGVALSGGQAPKSFYLESESMSPELELGVEDVEDEVMAIAEELGVEPAEVASALDALDDGEEEEEPEGEPPEEPDEDGEDTEAEDDDNEEEEEEEDEEKDMDDAIESLEERISNLEDMMDSLAAAEDVQELNESLEDARSELADAESVKELREEKEELEKRLSEVEGEPGDRRTLKDSGDDWEPEYDTSPAEPSNW